MSRRVMRGFDPQRLVAARRDRGGISQAELARRTRLDRKPGEAGIKTADTIRRWEAGTSSPSIDMLVVVVEELNKISPLAIEDLVHIPVEERYPGDWRILRGMTQPQLGMKAGLPTQIVGSVERGQISLSDNTARKLAAALEISEAELRASYVRVRDRPVDAPA